MSCIRLPQFGLAVLLCGLASTSVAADPKDEAVKKELKTLEGTWDFKAKVVEGNEIPAPAGAMQLVITGTKYVLRVEGKDFESGTITIDPSKSPRAIDFLAAEG